MHDEASRSTCNLTFALEKGVSKGKFDPRSVECILVGYAATSKAYRLYVPERRKVIVSNDVKVLKIRQDNLEADPSIKSVCRPHYHILRSRVRGAFQSRFTACISPFPFGTFR